MGAMYLVPRCFGTWVSFTSELVEAHDGVFRDCSRFLGSIPVLGRGARAAFRWLDTQAPVRLFAAEAVDQEFGGVRAAHLRQGIAQFERRAASVFGGDLVLPDRRRRVPPQ